MKPVKPGLVADPVFPDTATSAAVDLPPTVVGRPSPRWLTALVLWHSAAAHPGVLLVDGLIVAGAFRHLGTTRPLALAAGATFALISPITGLAAHRTSVQAQGIRWYLKPLAVVCALLVALVSLFHPSGLGSPITTIALIQASTTLILTRSLAWTIIAAARRRDLGLRSALVIGTDARVNELAEELAVCKKVGLRFAAG
ncbi:MAG: hypothetical protein QOK39_2771, partial [Acidimicrobiaceae bacterium]|nr:hypothetical protein [Acidimicrobiaceae bacterium]